MNKHGDATMKYAFFSLFFCFPLAMAGPVRAWASPANLIESGTASEMVLVGGGAFLMGSPEGESRRSTDEVECQVTLPDFYWGKFVVTQQRFKEVADSNPSHFQGDGSAGGERGLV